MNVNAWQISRIYLCDSIEYIVFVVIIFTAFLCNYYCKILHNHGKAFVLRWIPLVFRAHRV